MLEAVREVFPPAAVLEAGPEHLPPVVEEREYLLPPVQETVPDHLVAPAVEAAPDLVPRTPAQEAVSAPPPPPRSRLSVSRTSNCETAWIAG